MATTKSALRAHIEEQGYVVVPDAVPKALLDAVVDDIWRHVGADRNELESWYKPGIVASTGMVEMYHYQSMWNTRQYPRVHEIFAEVHGTDKLWVSIDRTNLKPPADPAHPEHDHKGFIHWDTDTLKYPNIPFRVQGVLAITDTAQNMGGFQCVPEMYRELEAWIARQPADRNPTRPDLTGYEITKLAMQPGDLVIWSTLLPHGNGHNVSKRPRLAQYIAMNPADEANVELRDARIAAWRDKRPMSQKAFPGDPRGIEQQSPPAQLTPLGRRLLGSDSWP
ncbi:MAG TPA: phytanoyl-CoA dioxygenase family protein [Chloroflexota bacterium]|nr:phytanoyl-CoA dioxygenase family protein [Chloroflexota bacterium]